MRGVRKRPERVVIRDPLALIGAAILLAATAAGVILAWKYRNVPMSDVPLWVWWLLR